MFQQVIQRDLALELSSSCDLCVSCDVMHHWITTHSFIFLQCVLPPISLLLLLE